MRKISGLILDVHDDVGGEIIRSMFPTQDAIPEVIKTAHALTADERQSLPDDVFALVMVNDEHRMRKFACHDPGNTALSVLYFLKTAHKLPEEARVVAAENLKIACSWYDLDVPKEIDELVLMKEAGIGTALTLMQLPGQVQNTSQNIKSNMAHINQAERGGNMVVTMDQMKGKHAEVTGTSDMPLSAPSVKEVKKMPPVKTAGMRLMSPVVDVSGLEPTKAQWQKVASHHALGDRYPLDSYDQVKTAGAYFEQHGSKFSLEDRREYCQNLVKRASELDIPLSETVLRYGGESYASDEELKLAMDSRNRCLDEEDAREVLRSLFEKKAQLDPDLFAIALHQFDKTAGLDQLYGHSIVDPYLSTFGTEKVAEDEEEDWTEIIGNDVLTARELKRYAKTSASTLEMLFGEDMAEEFRKSPVSIFRSLPMDQKRVIMRLATDNTPAGADL